MAVQHPDWSAFRVIADSICQATGSVLAILPERANTAAAWLAGVLPHRKAGGVSLGHSGDTAADMLSNANSVYLLLGVEAEFDAANPAQALATLAQADEVVSMSSYLSDSVKAYASVVLPMSVYAETFGTWVNAAGIWQSSKGVTNPPGDARPGWKILRVLGELLALSGFDYDSPEQITTEVQQQCADVQLGNSVAGARVDLAASADSTASDNGAFVRSGETPIYATDSVVRRSPPLQKTDDARSQAFAVMATGDAARMDLSDGDVVTLRQSWGLNGSRQSGESSLPVRIDDAIPEGSVWVPAGIPETATLGALFAPIDVTRHTSPKG